MVRLYVSSFAFQAHVQRAWMRAEEEAGTTGGAGATGAMTPTSSGLGGATAPLLSMGGHAAGGVQLFPRGERGIGSTLAFFPADLPRFGYFARRAVHLRLCRCRCGDLIDLPSAVEAGRVEVSAQSISHQLCLCRGVLAQVGVQRSAGQRRPRKVSDEAGRTGETNHDLTLTGRASSWTEYARHWCWRRLIENTPHLDTVRCFDSCRRSWRSCQSRV
jgi:hypothetical protein